MGGDEFEDASKKKKKEKKDNKATNILESKGEKKMPAADDKTERSGVSSSRWVFNVVGVENGKAVAVGEIDEGKMDKLKGRVWSSRIVSWPRDDATKLTANG